jgi:type VI secretion system protein ImpA
LLAPVTADDPCGPNLDSDPSYQELDRVAQGKPERQIGNTVVPAEEPDWKAMERLASGLLGRSKDLRVGIHLTNAMLRTQGWAGFAGGLAVLRGLTEQYWPSVHPQLDHESDNDPMERRNAFLNLTESSVLTAVRTTPLISSRVFGKITLRDVEVAAGESAGGGSTNGQPAQAASSIDAAAEEVDLPTLTATADAVRAAAEALAAIESSFASLSNGAGPNLSPLAALLKKARTFLDGKLSQRQPAAGGNGTSAINGGDASPAPLKVSGEINSREDVIRSLERISAYYARHEPSSPVPVLIERCKRLVSMSFIEIIRDLVPDGVNQVEVFRGRSE